LKGREICPVSTLTVLLKSSSCASVKFRFGIFSILRDTTKGSPTGNVKLN